MKKKLDNFAKLNYKKIANQSNNELSNFYNIDYLGSFSQNRLNRQKQFGKNINPQEKFNYIWEYIKRFFGTLNLLLLLIAILELIVYFFITKKNIEIVSFSIILLMIVLATTVDYVHEIRAKKINKDLDLIIKNKYYVVNNFKYLNDIELVLKNLKPIYEQEIVCGDILYLTKGDIVPADCKILWSSNLYIDQASLTGESDPIRKDDYFLNTDKDLELNNILYSQTTLVNGKCLALVIGVGKNKYTSLILNSTKKIELTNYDKGLKKIILKIVFLILLIIPIIFIIFGLKTNNWVKALILSLAIGIALIPESLTAIISSNLQYGIRKLRSKNVIVKKSQTIQTIGSVNLLAIDKTGTLTKDKIFIKDFLNLNGEQDNEVKKLFYLNAKFQSNITSLIDKEIVNELKNKIILNNKIRFIKEIQFSQTTRKLTIELLIDNEVVKISKGSVIEIIDSCSFAYINDQIVDLNQDLKNKILDNQQKINNKGLMTLMVMIEKNNFSILYGYIILENQLRDHVIQTIQLLYKNNVDLKIITGDNKYVSNVIANQVELKNINIFDSTNNIFQNDNLTMYNVFSRLDPFQKGEVIEQHKINGDVVAYLGDGLNDVVALSKADVGISVNNAKPLIKNNSDIILLEKDLRVLEEAFLLGRSIFINAIKFIKITITCNFGLLLSILLATLLFKFEAISPLQLLIQNLIYDIANLTYIFDNVDSKTIIYPCKWKTKTFLKFSIWNSLVPFIVSTINFIIIFYGMNLNQQINNANVNDKQILISQFQTMFFLESLITHMLMIFILRTEKLSFIKSRSSTITSISIIFFICFGLFLSLTPNINKYLGFSFDFSYSIWFIYLIAILVGCWLLGELFKMVYIKIFKSWI